LNFKRNKFSTDSKDIDSDFHIQPILEKNQKWAAEISEKDPDFFKGILHSKLHYYIILYPPELQINYLIEKN